MFGDWRIENGKLQTFMFGNKKFCTLLESYIQDKRTYTL